MNRIISRYILSSAIIALILLTLNIFIFISWIVFNSKDQIEEYQISKIADQFEIKNGVFEISSSGRETINKDYKWAMILDEFGKVVWNQNMPDEIPKKFNVSEVAGFSRWYLKDYPVKVWRMQEKLLVVGSAKGSIWKLGMEMQENVIRNVPIWIMTTFIFNCIVAVLLALFMGFRFYKSLKPIIEAVELLGENKEVHLESRGIFSNIAESINRTSIKLKHQEYLLKQRDIARTTWIAGVSHDIRTPLSLVMGYSSELEEDLDIDKSFKEKAKIIRFQSQKIKKLINNLNLASKLEYSMYPMKFEEVKISKLLRNTVAEILNSNIESNYSIELNIESKFESTVIFADDDLIKRAIINIIDNSIIHNPEGSNIVVSLVKKKKSMEIIIEDDGVGFPEKIVFNNDTKDKTELESHGLGLVIVKQILKLHGGNLIITNKSKGCYVRLIFFME